MKIEHHLSIDIPSLSEDRQEDDLQTRRENTDYRHHKMLEGLIQFIHRVANAESSNIIEEEVILMSVATGVLESVERRLASRMYASWLSKGEI